MADRHSKEQRSYNMSRIRSINTKPELRLKKILKLLGFQYQPKGISGRPDFADKKHKVAIFIDGCFWHKCRKHYKEPISNRDYWKDKIQRNKARDMATNKELALQGWRVIRIWEHSL